MTNYAESQDAVLADESQTDAQRRRTDGRTDGRAGGKETRGRTASRSAT